MTENDSDDEKIRGGPFTWYIIYFAGAGIYMGFYYVMIEYVNVGMNIALFLFLLLPFYLMYINEFYIFYTEEFDPEKPPTETEHYGDDE